MEMVSDTMILTLTESKFCAITPDWGHICSILNNKRPRSCLTFSLCPCAIYLIIILRNIALSKFISK